MKFLDKINMHMSVLSEADDNVESSPEDATSPDTTASAPSADSGVTEVAPEGYVDLVKLIAKAVAMNFPAGALDEIFRTEVTAENAFPMQTALEAAIKQNELYSDNPERLQNVHFREYVDGINASNFIQKYKHLIKVMSNNNPYIK
jgi:hypothetical protein